MKTGDLSLKLKGADQILPPNGVGGSQYTVAPVYG